MKGPFFAALALLAPAIAGAAHIPAARSGSGSEMGGSGSEMSGSEGSEGKRIRVRLSEGSSVVSVRGFDLRFEEMEAARKPAGQASAFPQGSTEWGLRCQGERVRAIHAASGRSLDLASPVRIKSPAGFIQHRTGGVYRPYRDELRVHAAGSLCEVVNVLGLEPYLAGLVNSEFSSKWSEEAVGAQVVAARTYALHQIGRSRGLHFDVDATVRDQVYDGSVKEDPRATRIVGRTRGLVLTAAGGEPLKAFYHSTCGGRTELPERVWGGGSYPGFKRTVPCPYCAHSPAMNWRLELSAAGVREAFLKGARLEGGPLEGWPAGWRSALESGQLSSLRVTRLDSQGRVAEVSAELTRGSLGHSSGLSSGHSSGHSSGLSSRLSLRIPGPRLRDWLGPASFRSTFFDVRAGAGGRIAFSGRGNGHGVGMCQYGAKTMGEKGFKTAAILRHYYPDARLSKLW